MPSFYQVEGISSEHPIQLLFHLRKIGLLKVTLEHLGNKVHHSLKEILILENCIALTIRKQNSHVYVTDLFALLLENVGLMSKHPNIVWIEPLLLSLLVLPFKLDNRVCVIIEFFEQFFKTTGVYEFPETSRYNKSWVHAFLFNHFLELAF